MLAAPDEHFLDMLEWLYESDGYRGGQEGVEAVNAVFREEGVAYQLTEFIVHTHQTGRTDTTSYSFDYPKVNRTTDHVIYQTTIQPALQLLSKAEFTAANKEMLEAHVHFRAGRWSDAITSAGKSFESVLKDDLRQIWLDVRS